MQKFSAAKFMHITSVLHKIEASESPAPFNFEGEVFNVMIQWVTELKKHCEVLGLRLSCKAINRLEEDLKGISYTSFKSSIIDISERIGDEMEEECFFHVPARKAEFFGKPDLFGMEVLDNFPSATLSIEESGNCYALGVCPRISFGPAEFA